MKDTVFETVGNMGRMSFSLEMDVMLVIGLLVFSAIISTVLTIYVYTKSRSGKAMKFFLSGIFLILVWTVLYIFEILAPTAEIRWLIVQIEYFPLCYVGFAFMNFSFGYNKHRMMSRKIYYLSLVTPTLFYIAVLTNKWHHVFYEEFTLEGEIFGPIAYLIIVNTSLYLLIGAYYFIKGDPKQSSQRQKQSIYFVIATAVPVTVHTLHTLGIIKVGFTLTLVFIPFSEILFIVSVLKYQFLDVLPIAVNDIIDSMMDGMVVIHPNGKIIDRNTTFFKKKLSLTCIKSVRNIEEFIACFYNHVENKSEINVIRESIRFDNRAVMKGTLRIIGNRGNKIIQYTTKPMINKSRVKVGTLLTFYDMTEVYQLYRELEEKNLELTRANERLQNHTKTVHQLTVESERNKIMAEIHDTLGHSMMELLALLEKADLVIEQKGDVMGALQEAIDKGRVSLEEVRSAVARYKRMGGIT